MTIEEIRGQVLLIAEKLKPVRGNFLSEQAFDAARVSFYEKLKNDNIFAIRLYNTFITQCGAFDSSIDSIVFYDVSKNDYHSVNSVIDAISCNEKISEQSLRDFMKIHIKTIQLVAADPSSAYEIILNEFKNHKKYDLCEFSVTKGTDL